MKRVKLSRILIFAFLVLIACIMLVPFVWLVIASLRPNMELLSNPFGIPETLNLNNYFEVWRRQPMLRYLLNTFLAALIAVVIDVVISVMTGYAMLHRFRMRGKLSTMFYVGLFIPANAFMVPYYVMITKIGLYNTIWGVGLIYGVMNLPFSIMIIRGFMETLPMQIIESGKIDGATVNQILIRLVLPMTKPGIVTVCIFIVINCWNELFFANLLTLSESSRTITVAIQSYLTSFEANYGFAFAAMIISILPTLIVYIFLTNKIIGGMTAGAVKG